MKHAQYNYTRVCRRVLAVIAVILAANPASAWQAGKPDPLLDGGDISHCMDRADLAAGVDATGSAVVPADVGAPPVPIPDEIAVPLNTGPRTQGGPPRRAGRNPVTQTGTLTGGEIYAGFDGRRMAPLINPKPCRH